MSATYSKRCPVCGSEEAADESQCQRCGTLLLGVDLTLKPALPGVPAPPPLPASSALPEATAATQAPAAPRNCRHADCAMANPPDSTHCLYCGRPLIDAADSGAPATPSAAVPPAPTFYRLPGALASKFRIAEVLPAGGAEAEIMVLESLGAGVKVIAKLYRPGLLPKADVLERVSRAAFKHVVHLLAWGESDGIGYEVMEYCAGGSLRQWMRAEPPPLRRDVLRDMLVEISEALAALHALDVIHRDLKPDNVLVRRREPLDLVLTDFGIASINDATQLFTSTARTVKYGAPETLAGVIDAAADWWSLGLILVELLTGHHPFDDLSDAVVTHRLVTGTLDCREIDDTDWRLLCRGLLLRDPQQRWGHAEVQRWLAGDTTLLLPPEQPPAALPAAAHPYRLEGTRCRTPAELALALATHWQAGRKDLLRGQLTRWFGEELHDDDLLRFTRDLLERRDLSDDLRLLRLIRRLAPDLPPVWCGSSLRVEALVVQAARAERGEAAAVDWLVSLYADRALHEWPATAYPAEAALADRWTAARTRFDQLWRASETQRTRWLQTGDVADFDALVFGQPAALDVPAAGRIHPPLLLALADAGYAQQMQALIATELAPYREFAPWLDSLHGPDDPAAWLVARLLLPHARNAAAAAHRQWQRDQATRQAGRIALVARANQALAVLREACRLGLFAGAEARERTAAAIQALLALQAEARATGLPAETPLMRTLNRAEPLAVRIQDRLDEWTHAARINALWRNRNLAQGLGGGLFFLLVLGGEVLPRSALFWIVAVPALLLGWRVWGLAGLAGAIRQLAKALPLRVPSASP